MKMENNTYINFWKFLKLSNAQSQIFSWILMYFSNVSNAVSIQNYFYFNKNRVFFYLCG